MKPAKHGRDHDLKGEDPIRVLWERKVFTDAQTVSTGDGKFGWGVWRDEDAAYLLAADAFVTTPSSSGTVTVQIRNARSGVTNVDMLSTRITIPAGSYMSADGAAVVDDSGDPPRSFVSRGDIVWVDVDVAGTGAKGLGVYLLLGPKAIQPGPP